MGWLANILSYASCWWFPCLVALGSGVNMFTMVLGGVLAAMYVTAVLSRPKAWFIIAVLNAVGTVVGVAAVVYLVEQNGIDWIKERFPKVFKSDQWKWVENAVHHYGAPGVILTSAAPIILHPLIAFSMAAKMNNVVLVLCIFVGRVLKYSIMAKFALQAPHLLKYFGGQKLVDLVNSKKKAEGKQE
uniref:SNARE associated Golgi protein n=1 Tax=Lotharella oceanica TaxID=641309 RepID=A0A7S2TPM4_9EUKA|mmetsp:Transcript_21135/g.39662  ORF Transcript_21135/g.39662 Transcript_21135/m.39662 type:complete len:187 (+) Transcript_21135:2-562(+)